MCIRDSPEALADQIKEKKKEISEVYVKINQGIDEIYRKYTDNISGEGMIMNEAEEKKAAYEEKLENFKKLPEDKICLLYTSRTGRVADNGGEVIK